MEMDSANDERPIAYVPKQEKGKTLKNNKQRRRRQQEQDNGRESILLHTKSYFISFPSFVCISFSYFVEFHRPPFTIHCCICVCHFAIFVSFVHSRKIRLMVNVGTRKRLHVEWCTGKSREYKCNNTNWVNSILTTIREARVRALARACVCDEFRLIEWMSMYTTLESLVEHCNECHSSSWSSVFCVCVINSIVRVLQLLQTHDNLKSIRKTERRICKFLFRIFFAKDGWTRRQNIFLFSWWFWYEKLRRRLTVSEFYLQSEVWRRCNANEKDWKFVAKHFPCKIILIEFDDWGKCAVMIIALQSSNFSEGDTITDSERFVLPTKYHIVLYRHQSMSATSSP